MRKSSSPGIGLPAHGATGPAIVADLAAAPRTYAKAPAHAAPINWGNLSGPVVAKY
jgi:hypothetical protein